MPKNLKLKAARAEKDMTQAALAEAVGVSRQTINAIEKGEYNPTINLCRAICKALGKTLDELFWEDPYMKQNIFSKKNQLDEMQEQTLRKIESRGFWLMWWGLFVVMIFQLMMQADIGQVAGEWIVFMAACLYTLEECLRNGIWDRHIKASLSTSIVGSLVGGVLFAAVVMFATHSLAVAGVTGVITVVFTFTLMQAAISVYKKRHQELENVPEETDEQK